MRGLRGLVRGRRSTQWYRRFLAIVRGAVALGIPSSAVATSLSDFLLINSTPEAVATRS